MPLFCPRTADNRGRFRSSDGALIGVRHPRPRPQRRIAPPRSVADAFLRRAHLLIEDIHRRRLRPLLRGGRRASPLARAGRFRRMPVQPATAGRPTSWRRRSTNRAAKVFEFKASRAISFAKRSWLGRRRINRTTRATQSRAARAMSEGHGLDRRHHAHLQTRERLMR